MDFLPYSVIGFSHDFLDSLNLGGELGKVFKFFNEFTDNIISTNSVKKNSTENTMINLLLDPKYQFTRKEIEDELIMLTCAVRIK
jgi:hypothetical protein